MKKLFNFAEEQDKVYFFISLDKPWENPTWAKIVSTISPTVGDLVSISETSCIKIYNISRCNPSQEVNGVKSYRVLLNFISGEC